MGAATLIGIDLCHTSKRSVQGLGNVHEAAGLTESRDQLVETGGSEMKQSEERNEKQKGGLPEPVTLEPLEQGFREYLRGGKQGLRRFLVRQERETSSKKSKLPKNSGT